MRAIVRVLLVSAVIACLAAIILAVIGCSDAFGRKDVQWVFAEKGVRTMFFTGFLTAGSFLMSTKVFILVRMNDQVYSTDYHLDKIADRARNGAAIGDLGEVAYGPLYRLKKLLAASIASCLLTSIAQITLGFIKSQWAAIACFSVAAFSLSLLLSSLYYVNENLTDWFDKLRIEARKKILEKIEEKDKAVAAAKGKVLEAQTTDSPK